jgi:hypothetical protein
MQRGTDTCWKGVARRVTLTWRRRRQGRRNPDESRNLSEFRPIGRHCCIARHRAAKPVPSCTHLTDCPTRHKYGIQKLDVPDLWLDLRRRSGTARGRNCAGHSLGRRSNQLDVSRMRRTQGRLRNGPDLSKGSDVVQEQPRRMDGMPSCGAPCLRVAIGTRRHAQARASRDASWSPRGSLRGSRRA